jgi:hypothetical protein
VRTLVGEVVGVVSELLLGCGSWAPWSKIAVGFLMARTRRNNRNRTSYVRRRYTQRSRPHVGRQPRRLARSERMPLACHALESSWSALGLSNAARGLFSPCALAARTPMKSTFVASAAAGRRVARSFLGKHPRSTYPDPPTSLAPRKPPWLGRLEKRPSLFRSFHTSRRRHRRAPRPMAALQQRSATALAHVAMAPRQRAARPVP